MCYCEAYMYITNIYPSHHLKLRTKDLLKVCVSLTLLRIESAGDNKIQTNLQLFFILKISMNNLPHIIASKADTSLGKSVPKRALNLVTFVLTLFFELTHTVSTLFFKPVPISTW